MKRREFITLLGGAATMPVLAPLAAQAQQPMPVIGFLNGGSADGLADFTAAFRGGLSETGFIEGQNISIEYRWAEGQYDRLPAMAADLVRRNVAVIAAIPSNAAAAAKAATPAIPIVFQSGADPVTAGLVNSLNRPGGNITGITRLAEELAPKLLELLREATHKDALIAFLVNPTSQIAEASTRAATAAARSLGLQPLLVLNAATEREVDAAFVAIIEQRANAVLFGQDVFFNGRIKQFAALALRHKVPSIYSLREYAAAGGLMSYGASLTDQYRLAGVYVGRILKGEKPADLPVQQATKVELVINLKTASTLGVTFPISLLGRADEVIE